MLLVHPIIFAIYTIIIALPTIAISMCRSFLFLAIAKSKDKHIAVTSKIKKERNYRYRNSWKSDIEKEDNKEKKQRTDTKDKAA